MRATPGRRIGRRELLRLAGRGALGGAAAAFLAACGVEGQRRARPSPSPLPPKAGELVIAQWPLYIDRKTIPSFEEATDVQVTYREVIADNQEFFAVISGSLSAGQPTGYDLIALSDWVVVKLRRAGWIEPLDHSLLPNVQANLRSSFRDPNYDPGNTYSVPWQGGITGIAYNPTMTGRDLTSFTDLWDSRFEGHVGMLTEMVDTMNMTLLSMGIEPESATVEDAARAQQRLLEQREAGLVRGYFGNDYIDGLARGDLWATMAWSGDIFWLKRDHPELKFVVPEEGGLLWATPLEIPIMAEHPRDAHLFLDYVYDPAVAADITSWVGYITPVAGVEDVLLQRAEATDNPARRSFLRDLAGSPLVFPTPEMEALTHRYKVLSEEEEREWNDLFQEVVQA